MPFQLICLAMSKRWSFLLLPEVKNPLKPLQNLPPLFNLLLDPN